MILPDEIPLFPLPNVVLFPDVYLPLHIFEERYRAMTRQALGGTRLIGMTVLREGSADGYDGAPPIYATGCAGAIVHHEALPDGRFNIVLQGVARFDVQREVPDAAPFRVARVRWHEERVGSGRRATLTTLRRQVETLLLPAVARGEVRLPQGLADQALINAVCQALDVPVVEKLALLEKQDVSLRAQALVLILERLLIMQSSSEQIH